MATPSRGNRSGRWLIAFGILALKAVGWALILQRYRRDLRFHRARVAAGSKLADTPCGVIEYGETGEGSPVLIIHGAGGGYDLGMLVAEYLGENVCGIAPSRFGYLKTPIPEHVSVSAQADAYACLLDELGVDRVTVLAVSAGGPSALQFALRHPHRVRGLIMVSAISDAHPVRGTRETTETVLLPNLIYWLMVTCFPDLVLAVVGLSRTAKRGLAPHEYARALKLMRSMLPADDRAAGIAADAVEANLFSGANVALEQISAPTLVIHARDDTLVPRKHAVHTAAHIPGAQLLELEAGGHFAIVTDAAVASIRAFIDARADVHSIKGA